MLDTNGRPVDRLLIKNVENFYFLFDGFPYVIAPVFSTPEFSIRAIYSCIFYSRIFSAPIKYSDKFLQHCKCLEPLYTRAARWICAKPLRIFRYITMQTNNYGRIMHVVHCVRMPTCAGITMIPYSLPQSCPWVGSTHGLGWVGWVGSGRDF